MTIAHDRRQKISQQAGVLTYVVMPWAPAVIRLAVAVLPGGEDVLIWATRRSGSSSALVY